MKTWENHSLKNPAALLREWRVEEGVQGAEQVLYLMLLMMVLAYILKASLVTPTIPQKIELSANLSKNDTKWPINDQNWPKMAQSGPRMTQNGPKWP